MKLLITGGKGMLGRTLNGFFGDRHEIVIADLPEWDITDAAGFTAAVQAAAPNVIVHCAAMTKVDDCESQADFAFKLNEAGSRNVAAAAKAAGARLLAISTDYVFSGLKPPSPDGWREDDLPAPRTVYGQSKLAGERAILQTLPTAVIVRIAWLYGAGGPSFIHTMAKLGAQPGAPLKVVDDQHGNPTSTLTVARVIEFLLKHPEVTGVVHGTCEGSTTWYELTRELFRQLNLPREVLPCTTAEFPRPAPRPAFSSLAKTSLNALGYQTAGWREALAEFTADWAANA